ncbi:MAG: hypothetical protein DWP97_11340, partial [Calditrichaeota bacterium]
MKKLLVALVILCSTTIHANNRTEQPTIITSDNIELKATQQNASAGCTLQKHVPVATGYASGIAPHDRFVTYYDPTDCGSPTYPFEIDALSFSFIPLTGNNWPVPVDVVVFAPNTDGVNCSAPGTELYRQSVLCDTADFAIPNIGTVFFDSAFCVDGPFYIGIEFTDPDTTVLSMPSLLFDTTSAPDSCDNWFYFDVNVDSLEGWYEWYDFWSPLPGYPWFWVEGETVSPNCVVDTDGDGIVDSLDNCPSVANPIQADADGDAVGDLCDNCPSDSNPAQTDTDGDGDGDVCDVCPTDHLNDLDGDGVCESVDNCPGIFNPSQADSDTDMVGDACENCCIFIRGNVNNDGAQMIDISDLVFLVDYMFGTPAGPQPPCIEEADVDASLGIDIADMVYLVDYMFGSPAGPAPLGC